MNRWGRIMSKYEEVGAHNVVVRREVVGHERRLRSLAKPFPPHQKPALGLGVGLPCFGFRISRFRPRVSGFRFPVSCSVFRISDFGCRVPAFGFRIPAFGFRLSALGFRLLLFGFRGWGVTRGNPIQCFRRHTRAPSAIY